MKNLKKWTSILLALAMLATMLPLSVAVHADCTTAATNLPVSTVNDNDYKTYGEVVTSTLSVQADGRLMTVSHPRDPANPVDYVEISYYNTSYKLLETLQVDLELPIYGGFYETEEAFYLLSGQMNTEESDSKEVVRLTKYDKSWTRLGKVSIKAINTYEPFVSGSARFARKGDILFIHTCHEMYGGGGVNHQANLTLSIDTKQMKLIGSNHRIGSNSTGYVSHSFNQFIHYDNGQLVTVDQGDGYPRAICLIKHLPGALETADKITGIDGAPYLLLSYPGGVGENSTYSSVGGFEMSDTHYLVVGNTECDFNNGNRPTQCRNVFLAVLSKDSKSQGITKLTNSTDGDIRTPQLVKLSANKFLVMWTKGYVVYYQVIDGQGNLVGSTYTMAGFLSDCQPIVSGGKVMWYAISYDSVSFFTIDTKDLSKTTGESVNNGHNYAYAGDAKDHWKQCKTCDKKIAVEPHGDDTYLVFTEDGYQDLCCNVCKQVISSEKLELFLHESYSSTGVLLWTPEVRTADGKVLKSDEDYYYRRVHVETGAGENGRDISYCIYLFGNYGCEPGYFNHTFRYLTTLGSVADIANQSYTGKAVEPAVTVTVGGKTLKEGTDYTVRYENNVNIGTATVTIAGKNGYFGTITKTFRIAKSITGATVTGITDKTYTGKETTQTPEVVLDGKTLKKDTDYTLSYKNNVKAGTASVVIIGKGEYGGTIIKTYSIKPQDVSKCKIALSKTSYTYNGKEQKPSVTVKDSAGTTLTEGTSYTVKYSSGCKVAGTYKVTITLKGNYSGTKTLTYKIAAQNISKCKVTLSATSYTYDGKVKKPTVTVKNAAGSKLTEGASYTVKYSSGCKVAGTYEVTITLKGNYSGTKTLTFKIVPQAVSKCKISLSTTAYTYNGKAKKPAVIVKDANGKTISSSNYTVTYASGRKNVGTYTVTVKMKGNYTGTKTLTFKILPTKTSLSKLTAAPKALTVKWEKKTAQVSGYEIQYATSKSFKSYKTKRVSKNTTTSVKLSGLSAKKTYYVRIRTYKMVNGEKVYSGWSAVKSCKTK